MRTRGLLLSLGWAVAIARESTVVRAQGGAPSHEELARAAVQRVLGRGAPETAQVYGEIAAKTNRTETQSPSLKRPGRPSTTARDSSLGGPSTTEPDGRVDVRDLLKSLSGYAKFSKFAAGGAAKFAAGGAASLLACMAATDAGDDVGAQAGADPLPHILQRVHNSKGDVNIIASAMSEAKTAGICEESLSQIRQVSQVAIMSAFNEEERFKEALKVLHHRMQTAKYAKTMEVALQKAAESGIPPHLPAMKKYLKRWQTRQKQESASPTSDRNLTSDDIEQVARVSGETEADDEATVAPRRLLLRQHDASLGDSSSWSSPPMVLAVTMPSTVLFVGVVWLVTPER